MKWKIVNDQTGEVLEEVPSVGHARAALGRRGHSPGLIAVPVDFVWTGSCWKSKAPLIQSLSWKDRPAQCSGRGLDHGE